jgi:hypothetical protein
MATSTMGIKCKPLSISEKLNIISKVDGTPNARCTKTAEEVQSLWNLKMYTANVFEKRARQTTLDKYFEQK